MGDIDAVRSEYRAILARAEQVLAGDERVVAVTVGGSVAAGDADEWSDLDLIVVTDPVAHDAFLAEWPTWLAAITPTVFARTPIAPFIINAITPDGLPVDVSVWPGEAPQFPPRPVPYTVGASPTAHDSLSTALELALAEQLRSAAGPFVSLVQRGEHFQNVAKGTGHLFGLLDIVFLSELDAAPPTKRWNGTYTPEQLAAVAALPPLRATHDDTLAFGLAITELMVTRSRPEFVRRGLEWPSALAAAVATRWRDVFGVDASDWLY